MPPSVKPKMFIASASCEENSPSRSHSPTAAPTTVETALKVSRGCCISDGISTAASTTVETALKVGRGCCINDGISAVPTTAVESSPNNNNNKNKGFSVCDILMEQRSSSTLKTVPLIVVSGHSRSVNNKPRSPVDFLPIQSQCGDDGNRRSPGSNSDYSLSPASSIGNARLTTTDKQSAGQHDISRRLKFGVDRILSDDSRVPTLANSHNTTGDVCGPSCTCADDMVQMPTFINSRPSFRNPSSTNYEYPSSHCDVNRHTVTAFYPSNVLPTPYAPTPWTIQSHYGHHHHHLLYPITTAVYPVSHMGGGGGNGLMDPARGYHNHYQSHHHHHGGLSHVVGGGVSVSGAAGSAVSAASAAAGVSNVGGKRKRSWSRAVFSNLQRKGLEKRFQIQKYITKPDRRQLAATLGLTDAQVKVWFQNRRMKWRHSKEAKEELAKQTTSAAVKVTDQSECRKLERTASSEPVEKPVEMCLKGSEQPC